MKKLLMAGALLALWSCTDENFREPDETNVAYSSGLPLYDFNEALILSTNTGEQNRAIIQEAIDFAAQHPDLYSGLAIGELDCFINITGANGGLKLPSEFHLSMSGNTILRVEPNATSNGSLIKIGTFNVSENCNDDITDVEVSGGQLIGDRLSHGNTIDVGRHLIFIRSAHNVEVHDVSMTMACGDGLVISGKAMGGEACYSAPSQINVYECFFDSNRRSNISIVDGHTMNISDNEFLNAGNTIGLSNGRAPGISVNVEGTRYWAGEPNNSELIWWQHPRNIHIFDNTESGSHIAFYAAVASEVTIHHNVSKAGIGYMTGDNIKVFNNTVNGQGETHVGIQAGTLGITTTVYDNFVFSNTVNNCRIGMDLHNNKTVIKGNTFNNCQTSIQASDIKDCEISNNTIQSNIAAGPNVVVKGLAMNQASADDSVFFGNTIAMTGAGAYGVYFGGVNTASGQENYSFDFYDNEITSDGAFVFTNLRGANIYGNDINAADGAQLSNNIHNVSFHHNVVISSNLSMSTLTVGGSTALSGAWNVTVNNNRLLHWGGTNSNGVTFVGRRMTDCTIADNGVIQNQNMTFRVIESTDSTVSGNRGDIGNNTIFVYGNNNTNVTFTDNLAAIAPFTRLNLNGVITIQ